MKPNNFTCKNVMPGLGCGFAEFVILGIIFYIIALVALGYFIKIMKKSSTLFNKLETVLWFSIVIWLLYKGTLFIFPFNYNQMSFRVAYVNIPAILYLMPVTILIWLICQLLFTYNSPGAKVKSFIKILLIAVVTVFLIVGVYLSISDVSNTVEPWNNLLLWYGCMNILTVFFTVLPGYKLLKAINLSSSEYTNCVNKSIYGLIFFSVIYLIRGLYNVLAYAKCNPMQNWINKGLIGVERYPPLYVRIFTCIYFLIFDGISAVLILVAALLMLNHSTNLATDPFFARQAQSESLI